MATRTSAKKQVHKALNQSEEVLRALINATRETLLLIDTKGTILLVNETAAERLGKSVQEFVGTCLYDHLPSELIKSRKEQHDKVFATGELIHFEDTRAGRSYETYCYPVFDKKGNISGVTIFAYDITEKKQAEALLKQEKEAFFEVMKGNPHGIILAGHDGRYLYVNPEFTSLTGYTLEDVPTGKDWYQKAYPDTEYRQKAMELWKEHRIQKVEKPKAEFSIVCKDGQSKDIEFRITRLKDSSITMLTDITARKQTEMALRESEEKYRNIFNDAILGIYQTTPDGQFLSANLALAQMCGYDTPEELTNSVTDLATQIYVNPEDRETFKRILFREGVVEKFETQLRKKNGEIIWVAINAHTVRDAQGNISHYEGTVEDITERKRAEEALRESEERVTKAFRSIPDALVISCLEDREIVEVNDSWYKVFGYSREEVIGKSSLALNLFADSADRQRIIALLREQGFVRDFQLQIRQKSGALRSAILSVESLEFYGDQYILTVIHDITERKQTQEKLQESEERYRILTEKTIAGIYLIQDGLFKYVNPTFCSIYGYTGDELVDKLGPLDLVVEEEREFANDKIQQRLSGEKESDQFSIRIRRKDGEIRFLEVFSSYALYAGEPAVLGTCIDMTEARKANDAIKRSQKELRSLTAYLQNVREEERTRIAREIHDELGQSLTGIKIDISWLKKKLADTVKPTDPIQVKIDSLLGLTESVIAITRELSLGLRPGILDDLGLVVAINWEIKRFQEKTGVICTFQPDVEEITIPEKHTTALFRICQECLTNVARHTQATEVKIILMGKGENLVLEIEDNGKGIITEQIRSPISLGLLGMRERVKSLQGRFHISGVPGKGTKVRVELPLK